MPRIGVAELIIVSLLLAPLVGVWCMLVFRTKGKSAGAGFALGLLLTLFLSMAGAVVALLVAYLSGREQRAVIEASTPTTFTVRTERQVNASAPPQLPVTESGARVAARSGPAPHSRADRPHVRRNEGVRQESVTEGAVVRLKLSQDRVALIDKADYPLVRDLTWHCHRVPTRRGGDMWYVAAHIPGADNKVLMHNVIMQPPPEMVVDHVNFNGLDNRRANLRLATRSQNTAHARSRHGSSEYRGVSWDDSRKMWKASIKRGGRPVSLGVFHSEEEAARAYDAAALAHYGGFALLNHPEAFGVQQPETARERLGHGAFTPVGMRPEGELDAEHPLLNKRVVFTGKMRSMARRDAAQAAVNCGATCSETVSRRTDYVVVGGRDHARFTKGKPSLKLKLAIELARAGDQPRVISEKEFLRMLEEDR